MLNWGRAADTNGAAWRDASLYLAIHKALVTASALAKYTHASQECMASGRYCFVAGGTARIGWLIMSADMAG